MRIESFGHRVIESFSQWLNDAMTQSLNVFSQSLVLFAWPSVLIAQSSSL